MSRDVSRDLDRATLLALALGALGAAALIVLGLVGQPVMPSYLGAWLVFAALPLGALPILMGCELLDVAESALLAALRRLAAVMPLAALLFVPVLLRLGVLYPALSAQKFGLKGWWMTEPAFAARAVLFLLAWSALSFAFARPAVGPAPHGGRRALAGIGLALHAVMGTLAAFDWAGEVEPSFNSSALGLLLMAAQASIAASVAVLLAAAGRGSSAAADHGAATERVATALAVLLAAWGFVAFTQYLVVWSANLPKEVVWYQHRSAGIGLPAEVAAAVLCALAFALLLPRALGRRAGFVAAVAAALLVLHGFEMLWLVTPAFRSAFVVTVPDAAALLASLGLGLGGAMALGARGERRFGHG